MKGMWAVFGIGCLMQWLAPLTQVMRYESVMKDGAAVRMECEAPDPYDLLRGRYLAVRVKQDEVKGVSRDQAIAKNQSAFAVLEVDAAGLAKPVQLLRARPSSGVYVEVTVQYVHHGDSDADTVSVRFSWPFDRLYLNENLAPAADQWYRDNIRAEKPILADLRVLDGRAVLVDLLQDGKSFRQLLGASASP